MGYCFLALSALLCLACVSDNGHPVLIYVWTQTVSYNSGRYKWSSLVYFLRILPTSVGSYEVIWFKHMIFKNCKKFFLMPLKNQKCKNCCQWP